MKKKIRREGPLGSPNMALRFRDLGQDPCGIVTFTDERTSASTLKARLRGMGINVSETSLSPTRIDMESKGLESMVRASVLYYNTEEELVHVKNIGEPTSPQLLHPPRGPPQTELDLAGPEAESGLC